MRKVFFLFAAIGALMVTSGCCNSCHSSCNSCSDAHRASDRAPAVAYADK